MATPELYVDHFIDVDRKSIRGLLIVGAVLVIFGAVVIFGSAAKLFESGSANIDLAAKVVGFITSLAGLFPFNDCLSRWQRMKTLQEIQRRPDVLSRDEAKQLIQALYKKFLGV